MNIELRGITVRELVSGYEDNEDFGVRAYDGKLDVRPPYQREFVYKDKQRDAVIDTLRRDFPLNVMYWAVRDDATYEIIDGQQRTISICQFVEGDFAFEGRYFHNLQRDEKEQVLDYRLTVYLCSGTDSERLDWFRTINIAGEELTDQELRNAVYAGPWVTDAKRHFSKRDCPAHAIGGDYMTGTPIRQDYLEKVIKWINHGDIEAYMADHQNEANANPLWLYFNSVISWAKTTFPHWRKEMKTVPWGELYNSFKDAKLDSSKLEQQVSDLMADEDVTKKPGIYSYVLSGQEKHLNIRQFTSNMRREAYERQRGICPDCKGHFELDEMEADHITPWHEGGQTSAGNCQMLCRDDNRKKGGK